MFDRLMKEKDEVLQSREQTSADGMLKESPNRQAQRLAPEELRHLLLDTIKRIRSHNENDKKLSRQRVQMKIHKMMEKTQQLTQGKSSKYVKMFYDGLRRRNNNKGGGGQLPAVG